MAYSGFEQAPWMETEICMLSSQGQTLQALCKAEPEVVLEVVSPKAVSTKSPRHLLCQVSDSEKQLRDWENKLLRLMNRHLQSLSQTQQLEVVLCLPEP